MCPIHLMAYITKFIWQVVNAIVLTTERWLRSCHYFFVLCSVLIALSLFETLLHSLTRHHVQISKSALFQINLVCCLAELQIYSAILINGSL